MISLWTLFTTTYGILFIPVVIIGTVLTVINFIYMLSKIIWCYIDDQYVTDKKIYGHLDFISGKSRNEKWIQDDWIAFYLITWLVGALFILILLMWPIVIPIFTIFSIMKSARFCRRTQKKLDKHIHDKNGQVIYDGGY